MCTLCNESLRTLLGVHNRHTTLTFATYVLSAVLKLPPPIVDELPDAVFCSPPNTDAEYAIACSAAFARQIKGRNHVAHFDARSITERAHESAYQPSPTHPPTHRVEVASPDNGVRLLCNVRLAGQAARVHSRCSVGKAATGHRVVRCGNVLRSTPDN